MPEKKNSLCNKNFQETENWEIFVENLRFKILIQLERKEFNH